MSGSFYLSTLGRVLKWAESRSLWYMSTGSGCCADEMLNLAGSKYDLERYGCLPQVDPRQSDLLIICGIVSYKAMPYLRNLYDQMLTPKYVLAVGACANSGGPFSPKKSYSVVPGAGEVVPVDVYVPGCPPRPEAIMNGLIALQGKISGKNTSISALE